MVGDLAEITLALGGIPQTSIFDLDFRFAYFGH